MIFVWRYIFMGLLAFSGGLISIYYNISVLAFIFGWIFGTSLVASWVVFRIKELENEL